MISCDRTQRRSGLEARILVALWFGWVSDVFLAIVAMFIYLLELVDSLLTNVILWLLTRAASIQRQSLVVNLCHWVSLETCAASAQKWRAHPFTERSAEMMSRQCSNVSHESLTCPCLNQKLRFLWWWTSIQWIETWLQSLTHLRVW